ncbi:MAG: peptidase S8 [Cytophagales bacterium]|nr:MAG: peptidase S8 [Cytophagales bacterium]
MRLFYVLFLLVGFSLSYNTYAQRIPQYSSAQIRQQKTLSTSVRDTERSNYTMAVEKARLLNRPLRITKADGTVQQLWGLDDLGNLLYEQTYSNTRAANTTRTSDLYAGGVLGLSLSGSSANVRDRLGVWDGGRLLATHGEFGGRVTQMDNPASIDNHATHVAGTMVAAGRNPLARGMAFGANIKGYDFSGGDTEMADNAGNYLVSNHSYGFTSGWNFNDARTTTVKWEWHGDTTINATDDYKFGFYDTRTRTWDRIANSAPYYLIVKSGGNAHGDSGPGAGGQYYLVNHQNRISTRPRNDQNGYDQISTNGTAKNILTVAAISNISNGYNAPSDVRLGSFSSWGPTDDGRIKPDISAVGVSVLSTGSRSDSAYAVLSGTSMSTPNTSGSVLLLQELYSQRNNGEFMRASTLKGLVLHTANEAGDAPGPDYRFGWGLLNTGRAGQVILNTDRNHLLSEQTLNQGQTYSIPVVASGRGPLVVSISWHDPESVATTVTAANHNNRTPKLVNDLDVRVSSVGIDGARQTGLPWVLNPDQPDQPATTGDNIRDNIEQVMIANPVPGRSYTITVTHKSSLTGNKQDYALLASGIGGMAYCASGPTSTTGLRIDRVQVGTVSQTGLTGCTSYTDFMQTPLTVQVGQRVPLVVTLGTCSTVTSPISQTTGTIAVGGSIPVSTSGVVRAFADWNGNGSFSDPGDTLTTSGIVATGGSFSALFSVPATVADNQIIRLRLVAVEGGNPAQLSPCGSYSTGETQDYLLRTVRAANDVGVVALVTPDASYCAASSTPAVTVRLRNFGTDTQRNLIVAATLTDLTSGITLSGEASLAQLGNFRDGLLRIPLPANAQLTNGRTYRIAVSTRLPNDQNPANDRLIEDRTITTSALATANLSALVCGNDSAVALRNNGTGTAFWYDALNGGNLLAAGNQTSIRRRQEVFYVGLNALNTTIGPASKATFGGGTYAGNFGPAPLISTRVPILLESARIYVASAGTLIFTVRRLDDVAVSSVSLNVTPTRNTALTAVNASNQLVDDPNDAGLEYPLNLRIPSAGDYKITIDYEDGAALFRSNVGVTGFPYQIRTTTGDPIVTMRGSLFNATTTRVDTLTNAWYYLYSMRVRSLDCPAPQRTAVTTQAGALPTVSVAAEGSTTICRGAGINLTAVATNALSYQWLLNGQAIGGATGNSYRASTEGAYTVQIAGNCLPASSSAVQIAVREAQLPTLVVDGLTLRSSATISNQWLLNGVPITGATSQSIVAAQTGRYAVRGNVNGCGEAISAEVLITILANEDPLATEVQVYPNPTTRRATVRLLAQPGQRPPTVRLVTTTGVLVAEQLMLRESIYLVAELDVDNLPPGTFFAIIQGSNGQQPTVARIVKL